MVEQQKLFLLTSPANFSESNFIQSFFKLGNEIACVLLFLLKPLSVLLFPLPRIKTASLLADGGGVRMGVLGQHTLLVYFVEGASAVLAP